MNTGLTGKRVLVTAATKGIGRAVVDALLEEGCNVYLSSSSEYNVTSVTAELNERYPGKVAGSVCDLTITGTTDTLLSDAESFLGGIDILVNNCGGPRPGFFGEFSKAEWEAAHNQILVNASALIERVLPGMKKQNHGRIINITSVSVKQPADNLLLSNVYRAALTALSKTLASQIAPAGVTINNVAPGYTRTSRIEELAEKVAKVQGKTTEQAMNDMAANIPMKRMATAAEIAAGVVYFASAQAAFTTGQTLLIDGGMVRAY